MHRKNLDGLSRADTAHLVHDVNRGYRLLVFEWVTYMEHLKEHYPYLFSLAMRTNPFDPEAQAEISDQEAAGSDTMMPGQWIIDPE
jgi:hypothetical protein